MRKTFFLPLADALSWPESDIGHLAYHLGKLVSTHVPILPGLVVPRSTLEIITQQNHLDHKLQQWFQSVYLSHTISETQAFQELLNLFTHLHIDSQISSQFIELYYQVAKNDKVIWTASWAVPTFNHLSIASDASKGEANVFELLLETWCQSVWTALLNSPTVTRLSLSHLIPSAFLLQTYHPSAISGWVMTSVPDEPKSHYGVFLEQRPDQPSYLIDVRTWHILKREKETSLPLHDSLNPAQALEAAQFANRVKLHDFHHLKISWSVIRQQLFITNIERLQVVSNHEVVPIGNPALVVGQTVVRGQTTAKVTVLKNQPAARSSFAGEILVIPELLTLSLTNLKGLKGVVVDHLISLKAQALLRAHHIPTLAHARTATRKIKTGQLITLNTFEGKISLSTPIKTVTATTKSTRRTGLIAEFSNLSQLQTTELSVTQGLFINGNEIWTELGQHPQHILRTTAEHRLKTHLQQLLHRLPPQKPLLYRPLSLTSDQQQQLEHASAYVTPEKNPQLGYYGAIQLLQQPHTLALEINLLAQQVSNQQSVTLVLPATRTAAELTRLIGFVRSQTQKPLKLAWELDYPENIWGISRYPFNDVDQVILNVPQLYGLSLGIDIQESELAAYYLFDPTMLKNILESVTKVIKPQQIWLQTLPKAYQALSQVVVEHHLAGLIGPISDVATIHHQLQIAEYHWLMSRKTLH